VGDVIGGDLEHWARGLNSYANRSLQ